MKAPTAAQIIAAEASFAIHCARCRMLRERPELPARLVREGRGDVPIDQLTFRCQVCREVGTPWATGPGNALLGRKRLWPPET